MTAQQRIKESQANIKVKLTQIGKLTRDYLKIKEADYGNAGDLRYVEEELDIIVRFLRDELDLLFLWIKED